MVSFGVSLYIIIDLFLVRGVWLMIIIIFSVTLVFFPSMGFFFSVRGRLGSLFRPPPIFLWGFFLRMFPQNKMFGCLPDAPVHSSVCCLSSMFFLISKKSFSSCSFVW